jgi:glycosyltransferase involved in cell wall biosynthesis
MDTRSDIKVSVSLITYNQKEFISHAIEGVIKQKTNFKFELIVGDDCSTDGTRAVIINYQQKYPGLIRLILHPERNSGVPGKLNFISTLKAAGGEYLALVDGDDYWTDQHKLQKQVEFLENNPEYAVCCHDVFHRKAGKIYRDTNDIPVDTDLEYLLRKGNYISTPSVVYRNDPGFVSFMEKFPEAPFGDYLMNINAASRGKIKFLKQRMAVYRIHSGGVWSKLSFEESLLKTVFVLEMLYDYFREKKYQDDLKIQLLGIMDELSWIKEYRSLVDHPSLLRLFKKMGIPEFMPAYLKFNAVERSAPSYFARNISARVLARALKDRLVKRIFGG